MQVRALPVDPGPAGWEAILPPAPDVVPLEGNVTTDWLVIGAGFAGLAAARRLTQLDPTGRITVVDATRVGAGPAGRNSGFMIDLPHDLTSDDYGGAAEADQKTIAQNRHAIAFAKDMADAFGLGDAFSPRGKINGAATARGDAHNARFARHLATLGEAHTQLDASEMHEITGSHHYRSGLYTPGTVMLQPAAYVRGVAAGLRSNRVHIHEMTPVTALERKGDWVASTPKGRITAPRVILAVNGHLNSFGHVPGRLMHVFTYASMTRALTTDEVAQLGGKPDWSITSADPMGTTVRRISGQGGDRIVVRNRFTFDPDMRVDTNRINRVARDHDRAFAARFPQLAGIEMSHRWGGRLCLSRNGVQVVRELEPGLFSACVQNGLGTARGTLAGLCAAELAAGQPSAIARDLAQADEPSRVPPFAKPFANGWLKFLEWRAGNDL